MSSANQVGVPAPRAGPVAPLPDPRAPPVPATCRVTAGHLVDETGAPRRAHTRSDNPPRGPRGDGVGRVAPGSTALSGRLGPSAAHDGPPRPARGSPEIGSSDRDGAAPAAAPAESSASELQPRSPARPRRAASLPGSRHRPAAVTFPRERGSPHPERIGRVGQDPPAPPRPRALRPGIARLGHRGRAHGATRSPPVAPARLLAAEAGSGPPQGRRRPLRWRDAAGRASRAPRLQGPQEQRTHLRGQAPAQHHGAISW